MKVKALLAIVASLSLAACAVPDEAPRHHGHDHGHNHGHAHQQQGGINASFNCENGLAVHVRSLSTDSIELRLDDKRAVLKSAVAGSGERYTSNTGLFGKGAEWHQKGSEAFFAFTDPYGNKVETSCNAR
ncbi:MliC family protein [Neisseria elongata]|uniref:MliC family protein n=1 Tax=Neisseria elongata TaxID=495 RepID=UPI0006678875|nr:MliC family protein [Neisseria elongata]